MENKPIRIGLLIPNLQSGGAERVLSLTSVLLSQAGYEVYLILFDVDNINYSYSGKLINLQSKAGSTLISKMFIRVMRILKLSYYKYKFNLDVTISFLYAANIVNFFSIGKSKKILSCRGYSDYIKNGRKYSLMMKSIDKFIVQTERMKNDFVENFNSQETKISVIYNPFDIEEIKEKSREPVESEIMDFINHHKTICTVGAFKKDKGYWHLIKSFIEVKKKVNNAGLIFVGHRGEMEQEILKMAEFSGFKNDILFLGFQDNPFKYISKCDLFVCSSIHEGFPNALVEAMTCGTPIVSTDCKTGPKEILGKYLEQNSYECEFGILSPELDGTVNFDIERVTDEERILASNIVKMLDSKELLKHYSRKSCERAESFSVNNYLEELQHLLDS